MKIKYNIPMINKLKERVNIVRDKIDKTKKDKEKVPMRYYALLLLMVMIGVLTLMNNLKEYSKSKQEEYKEYKLYNEEAVISSVKTESNNVIYITDVSSIYTEEANIEETIATMSSNTSDYILPVKGNIIKKFAVNELVYSKTLDMWKTHQGIDISADIGEEVKAVSSGEVLSIEQDDFYGYTIKITDSLGYIFVYSNLENNIILKKGDKVEQGDIIGNIGVSAMGEIADESHLHFEVLMDNEQVNPVDLLKISE